MIFIVPDSTTTGSKQKGVSRMRRFVLTMIALSAVMVMSGCAYLGTMGNLYVSSPYGLSGIVSSGVVQLRVWGAYPYREGQHLYRGEMYIHVRDTNWRLPVTNGEVIIPIPQGWNRMTVDVDEWYDRYRGSLPSFSFDIDLRTRGTKIFREITVDSRPY